MRKTNVYDVLKTLTMLFVILGHVCVMWADGVFHPVSVSPFLGGLAYYAISFHMPMFFFVSGSVYRMCLHRTGGYYYGAALIRRRAGRLLVPYLLTGCFWVAPVVILVHQTKMDYMTFVRRGIFLAKDTRHLWFLLALFSIDFVCGLLSYIRPLRESLEGEDRRRETAVLGGIFLVLAGIGYLSSFLGTNPFQIRKTMYYAQFFCLGMIGQIYEERLKHFPDRHPICWAVTGILPVFLFSLGNYWIGVVRALLSIVFYFGLAARLLARTDLADHPLFRDFSGKCMEIYLLHPMIVYGFFYLLGQKIHSAALMFLIAFGGTLVLSDLLAGLLLCGKRQIEWRAGGKRDKIH